MAHLRGAWTLRRLTNFVGDLGPEGVGILLDNVRNSLRPDAIVLLIVATVRAVAVGTAVSRLCEAFTVELQALRVLAAAAFALSLHPAVRVASADATRVIDARCRA